MTALLLWCVCVVGLSSLACAMAKHQREIFSSPVSQRNCRLFQTVGWGLLIISAGFTAYFKGISIGLSEWLGCVSFAALAVGLLLTYSPKKMLKANAMVAVLFLILLVIHLL
ncbi:DUF3325 domain-containing protein [Acinetobacter sp. 2JN-4]|uniref:DUF3325 domain-containing protein n=1 Tax=Acinetobacter sp. 2JN-4 TaxID=2479844 RepID=UPI000EF99D69|nr:DUF3325 domain-containing protein [Acinetobacter sp. 2JN-4]RLZ09605.1 DUF3325 domain-containing protein [Acinetobacter sp. 2JN-4]